MAEDPKTHALRLIKEFKARGAQPSPTNPCAKDGIWLNVCRNKVADGLENRIYFPNNLNQLSTNICGVAAFVRQWIIDDPVGFAWLGISLYETGCGYLGRGKYHGKVIRPSKELLNSTIPNTPIKNRPGILLEKSLEMNHADWIVMASIREEFNSIFDYSADEGIFAIKAWNFPSEVIATFKAAGYVNVVDDTSWSKTKGWENLIEASNKFQNKWRVVLLINARMLDDKTINTQAFIDTSDHWVGLQSAIHLTLVGSEHRIAQFKVFTWGKEKKVPAASSDVPLNALLKNYYGYIAAKY
jgi:hypothetical protein